MMRRVAAPARLSSAATNAMRAAVGQEEHNAAHVGVSSATTFDSVRLRLRLRNQLQDASKNHELAAAKSIDAVKEYSVVSRAKKLAVA
jgi:hypothetical protein